MPNRILKESICSSDNFTSLSWFEQILFVRLIVTVDDYGRMDGRPPILKGRLFPLENVSVKDITAALQKLSAAALVILYEVGERPYLQLTTWSRHQKPRARESKFPPPPSTAETCKQMQADENICKQMQADENICKQMQADAPDIRIRYSYSDSIIGNRYSDVCAELSDADSPPLPPPVIYLTLNDKTEYAVTQKKIDEWSELYPAVDVMQQLRNMKGWLNSNPKKRKTRSGIERFITGWLASEQNKGGGKNHSSSAATDTDNIFLQMMDEERKQ